MFKRWLRILTFRADADDHAALDRRFLVAGLLVTWLVGIGRYWDNPRVELLQKTGVGSLVYVVALASLLWLLGLGLRPHRWRYLDVLVFVTLTAPPGLLYAIPVEKLLSPESARSANLAFLGVVATRTSIGPPHPSRTSCTTASMCPDCGNMSSSTSDSRR